VKKIIVCYNSGQIVYAESVNTSKGGVVVLFENYDQDHDLNNGRYFRSSILHKNLMFIIRRNMVEVYDIYLEKNVFMKPNRNDIATITCLQYDPMAHEIIAAYDTGSIRGWAIPQEFPATCEPIQDSIRNTKGHNCKIIGLTITKIGTIISAGIDGILMVWRRAGYKFFCEKILEGPKWDESPYFLLTSDDKLIAATNNTICIWNASGELKDIIHYDERIVGIDAEENKLAVVGFTTLKVFEISLGTCIFLHIQTDYPLSSVKLDGPFVIVGSKNPTFQVFNMHQGNRIVGMHECGTKSMQFIEQNLITVGESVIYLWNHKLYTSPAKKFKRQ